MVLQLSDAARAASPVFKTLYDFTSGTRDYQDLTSVVIGPGGVLYGNRTGSSGAAFTYFMFSLTPPASAGGVWTGMTYPLPARIAHPTGTLAITRSALYGTSTNGGGSGASGAVFSAALPLVSGGVKEIYAFRSSTSGQNPATGVALGPGGVLYGTTNHGGTAKCGTVYSLTPPSAAGGWTEAVIYNIAKSDGCGQLFAPVVVGSGGVVYVTGLIGGAAGNGRVFSLTPPTSPGGNWAQTVLYDFTGPTDGIYPQGLTIGSGNVIYGATNRGGANNGGTVFSLTPPSTAGGAWAETTLYAFTSGNDGGSPLSGVVIGRGGELYGTTSFVPFKKGNVYALYPPSSSGGAWTEVSLHIFTGGSDGAFPSALAIDSSGVLYGTTEQGGSSGYGAIFSLVP